MPFVKNPRLSKAADSVRSRLRVIKRRKQKMVTEWVTKGGP